MTAICVAGMHRSGTSMVTRLLNLCGMYLGEESQIVPPGRANAEGFWENRACVEINDGILAELGAGWDFPPAVEPGWAALPALAPWKNRAGDVINGLHSNPVWGWKDPRNSLTYEFWRQLIPDLKVIICLRNPLEVAKSLKRRNAFSRPSAYHLWLVYNQRLLSSVAPGDRLFTHYDSYFNDPAVEVKRLLKWLGLDVSDGIIEAAVNAVSLPLRNQRATLADLLASQPPAGVARLYSDLCEQAGVAAAAMPGAAVPSTTHAAPNPSSDPAGPAPAPVVDSQRAIVILTGQLAAKDDSIRILSKRIEEQAAATAELRARLAGREQELEEIYKSRAWKLAAFLRRIRLRVFPPRQSG